LIAEPIQAAPCYWLPQKIENSLIEKEYGIAGIVFSSPRVTET
jgi:hypothetical protein